MAGKELGFEIQGCRVVPLVVGFETEFRVDLEQVFAYPHRAQSVFGSTVDVQPPLYQILKQDTLLFRVVVFDGELLVAQQVHVAGSSLVPVLRDKYLRELYRRLEIDNPPFQLDILLAHVVFDNQRFLFNRENMFYRVVFNHILLGHFGQIVEVVVD